MPDIYLDLPVNGSAEEVFEAISTPEGLSKWWSRSGTGIARVGEEYSLDFGPEYQWKAEVVEFRENEAFSMSMKDADRDWTGSVLKFRLVPAGNGIGLEFEHLGWPEDNDHYRSSAYCWAMYLRCLKQYVEKGIVLPYEERFEGR